MLFPKNETPMPPPGLLRLTSSASGLPLSSMLKQPRQRRSRDMVHAILDATIMVIEGEGPEAFTTNRVAEVAGISVGSLYQYFANKEMLLSGAVERGILDSEVLMRETFAKNTTASPHDLLHTLTWSLVEGLRSYRRLLIHVFSVTPIAGKSGVLPMLESRMTTLFRDWLSARSDDYTLRSSPAGLVLGASAAVFLFVRWMTDLHEDVPEEDFVNALTLLIVAGLEPVSAP